MAHSAGKDVWSGILQVFVLGPEVVSIFVNDLDDGIENMLLLFADDYQYERGCKHLEDGIWV